MNKIVLTKKDGLVLSIEFHDQTPVRIFPAREEEVTLGSIYVGRVQTVKKDLNAAFVDFAPTLTGFLPLEGKTLKQGDLVCVRLKEEPVKTKFYTLSMDLELAGTACVVSDRDDRFRISSKLSKEAATALKEGFERGYSILHGGILRTNAASLPLEEVIREYRELDGKLDEILKYGNTRALYSCLYREKPAYIKALFDLPKDSFDKVITDDPSLYEEVSASFPAAASLHDDPGISLEAKYRVRHALSLATDKKVHLNCGGYLVIEPTEALTVIDVNSGKFDKKLDRETMIRKVNFEAADMVASQLILRNISGMIVVDFINFENKEEEEELLSYMRSLLKKDPCRCKVHGFTALKFMEISRQKIRASLYDYGIRAEE